MPTNSDSKSTITTLSLMRHGHVHNPDAVYYGRLPNFRLSETGREEAQHTAVVLQNGAFEPAPPVSHIYSSPLLRAQQTAAIVRDELNLKPTINTSELLLEIHSPYDGETLTSMEARNWNFYADINPPYEQPPDILGRVQQFMRQIVRVHSGEHVLAVTHGDIITFTLMWAMGLPLQHEAKARMQAHGLPETYVGTASLTTLRLTASAPPARPKFRYLNPRLKQS